MDKNNQQKQTNQTLAPQEINPLLPDANSVMATMVDVTRSDKVTKAEKLYRYKSGIISATTVVSLGMITKPDYWILDIFGAGTNTDFSLYEDGVPTYFGTVITGKIKVVIPANSRTINLSKSGTDVYYILAGCIGYEPENIL